MKPKWTEWWLFDPHEKFILQVLLGFKLTANVKAYVSILSRSAVNKNAVVLISLSTTINKMGL